MGLIFLGVDRPESNAPEIDHPPGGRTFFSAVVPSVLIF